MERGDVKDCRNPSSAILGRIKDAQKAGSFGGSSPRGNATPEDVEQFIAEGGLDDRAQDALRGCPPDVQRVVIDRGPLTDTRNPSSAVLGRIRDAQGSPGSG